MEGSLYNQKAYVCYHDNTNSSSSDSIVVWWVGSVDELSGDLLQGTEGLLELEAFGDGLLLGSQDLLLWGGGGGLAALTQGVGSHDYQLLRQRTFPFFLFVVLLSCSRAPGRFRATGGAAGGGAGCLVLRW